MTERRRFLVKAGGVMAAAATAAIVDAPHVIAQPKIQWRMSTAWTKGLDNLQGAATRLAQVVEETSGGRFRIEVFPGGQIVQPLECFDAASKGTIEAFMASSSYWTAKEPAVEWFVTIPFGSVRVARLFASSYVNPTTLLACVIDISRCASS